jgi:ubiquinone/menaquinone biosynthesis methyltransferase
VAGAKVVRVRRRWLWRLREDYFDEMAVMDDKTFNASLNAHAATEVPMIPKGHFGGRWENLQVFAESFRDLVQWGLLVIDDPPSAKKKLWWAPWLCVGDRHRARRFTVKIGDHLQSPAKKRDYNEKLFCEVASKYDFITRALSCWHDASWKRDLIASLPTHGKPLCVDIACGTGDISFLLAEKYPRGHVTGLDISEPMLDIARGRNACRNVLFVNQDMSHLGLSSKSVDVVTGGYALRNAPDLEVVIDEIHRILKPDGVAAFLDFSKPNSMVLQQLEYWLLKIWGGFWGILLHRNHEVYGYIAESLRLYPERSRLRNIFRDKGFTVSASRLYFLGITELLVVKKVTG